MKAWQKEVNTINEKIKELNPSDMLWLTNNYAEWAKENLLAQMTDQFIENLSQ